MRKSIQISDVETAVRIYYAYPEIGNDEISKLFGTSCRSTLTSLKTKAREEMNNENVKSFRTYTVNTKCAYRAWGLNIKELERDLKKLRDLGFLKSEVM